MRKGVVYPETQIFGLAFPQDFHASTTFTCIVIEMLDLITSIYLLMVIFLYVGCCPSCKLPEPFQSVLTRGLAMQLPSHRTEED